MSERFQKHFVTDHLVADLKGRSVRGGAVTLTAQAIKFVLQMGSTMVLARLLLPSDFGLIAMVTAIIGFVAMFKDAGLSMATVQRQDVTHEQVSTLFWINVALSAAVMLLVAALAPAIAAFYSEPRLVWVTLALAGTMLFGGFTVQHQALLRRQMRFKALAVIEIASMAGGVGVAVTMAVMDFGYWSLVGMTAATALTNAVLVWLLCDWRPGAPRRYSGVGEMVKFGGGLSLASLFNYAREQGPFIMIGWVFGPGLLAVYERAYRLLVLPLKQMMPPVSAVAIPVLSRLQEDEARFRSTARKLLYVAALCSIFPSAIAVVIAPELIQIFLGDQWQRSAIIFACLVPLAATQAVSAVMVWCITSTGRSLALVRFGFANASIALLTVGAGATYGIEWAAAAFSCGGVFIRTPLLYLTVIRNTPITSKDLLGETWIFFAMGTLVSTVGLILRLEFVGFEHVSFGWMAGWTTGSALFFLALMHQLRSFDRIHQLIGTRQP